MIAFEQPGKDNTEKTVEIAVNEARKRGIKDIVVASYSGKTAELFKGACDLNIVVVRGAYGSIVKDPNTILMSEEMKDGLEKSGMTIVTSAHALSGAERSLSSKFTGIYPTEIISYTLRMLGQGTKVCVECATMACDAGAIPVGVPVIAVGGTAGGADTAIIMKASLTRSILDTEICEILCKPSLM